MSDQSPRPPVIPVMCRILVHNWQKTDVRDYIGEDEELWTRTTVSFLQFCRRCGAENPGYRKESE